jgi:hypothetical protein
MNACSRDELWEILVHINVAEIPQNNCKVFGNRSKPIETGRSVNLALNLNQQQSIEINRNQ